MFLTKIESKQVAESKNICQITEWTKQDLIHKREIPISLPLLVVRLYIFFSSCFRYFYVRFFFQIIVVYILSDRYSFLNGLYFRLPGGPNNHNLAFEPPHRQYSPSTNSSSSPSHQAEKSQVPQSSTMNRHFSLTHPDLYSNYSLTDNLRLDGIVQLQLQNCFAQKFMNVLDAYLSIDAHQMHTFLKKILVEEQL